MFEKAIASWRDQDYTMKGNYLLLRYIKVSIPTNVELKKKIDNRIQSGWGISSFEKELFGSLENMKNLFSVLNCAINETKTYRIDLLKNIDEVVLEI